MTAVLALVLSILCLCLGKEDNTSRFIIACRSTDFVCFKRQYELLRREVLMGNHKLGIPDFTPYYLRYGDTGTCIRITGFEESVLRGIAINHNGRYYKLIIGMPFKLQQLIFQNTQTCARPHREFPAMPLHTGPLKRFEGNATMLLTFPFYLKKKKGKSYMILGEEGVDVILDILDLTDLKDGSFEDKYKYQLSEWAYDLVQHVNIAEGFAMPFTAQLREFGYKVTIDRYIMLYPDEEYATMRFNYSESPYFDAKDFKPIKNIKLTATIDKH